MRGISTIVVTVIIISVAVITAVTVSDWILSEVSEQTSSVSDCSVHTRYIIESAKFRSSTNETRIIVTNKGAEAIYGFSLQIENGTHIETIAGVTESPATSSSNKLAKERSVSITYTSLGNENRTLGMTATRLRVMNTGCPEVFAETETIKQTT